MVKRIILSIILGVFLLLLGVVILIRTPWGQGIIVNKATSYISNKTNTKITIDKMYLTFSGNLLLEGVYLEDKKKDTLVYSKKLEASVALLPLIRRTEFYLKELEWTGLKANINRRKNSEEYNFDFLLKAFNNEPKPSNTEEKNNLLINIDQIKLSEFDLNYDDNYLGIEDQLKFDNLTLNFNAFDIEKMFFDINQFHFSKVSISHIQTKPLIESKTDSSATAMPKLNIDDLKFKNINVKYVSIPDAIRTEASLGTIVLNSLKTDLETKIISATKIGLDDSQINLKIKKQKVAISNNKNSIPTDFIWPDWKIDISEVNLKRNQLQFKSTDTKGRENVFNPEFIALKNFNFKSTDLIYEKGKAEADLKTFSFKERSGFMLKKAGFKLALNNNRFDLSGLEIVTSNNKIAGKVKIQYSSIKQAINKIEEATIDLNMPVLELSAKDALYFEPTLKNNPIVKALQKHKIFGKFKANGNLTKLNIPKFNAKWNNTQLQLVGAIENVLDSNKLKFNLKNVQAKATKNDIEKFVSEEQLGSVVIPEEIEIKGIASGTLKAMSTDLKVLTTDGDITIKGKLNNGESYGFNGLLNVENLQLNKLIQNEQLGQLSLKTKMNIIGKEPHTLSGEFVSDFSKLEINGYSYEGLNINGKITNGKGVINSNFKDTNLNASLKSTIDLDSINYKLNLLLDVKGADLYALNLSDKKNKTKFKLNTSFEGNPKDFVSTLSFSDVVVVVNNDTYNLGDLYANASVDKEAFKANIKGSFIKAKLNSNTSPSDLVVKLKQYFNNYFSKDVKSSTKSNTGITLELDATINEAPVLNEVLFPELRFDNIVIEADYNENTNQFKANLSTPSFKYKKINIGDVSFSANGNNEDLKFDLGVNNLDAGIINIKNTNFQGKVVDEKLKLKFNSSDGVQKLIQIHSEISQTKENYIFTVESDSLVFNKKEWKIPTTNKAVLSKNKLVFNNFNLTRNKQALTFSSSTDTNGKDQLNLIFDNFKLGTFTSFLNAEEAIASGIVHGDLTVEDPFNKLGIIADLSINDLGLKNQLLGDLKFTGQSKTQDAYTLQAELNGTAVDLSLSGNYTANTESAILDFDIDLEKLELKLVEPFISKQISETAGIIFGNIKLQGTTSNPKLEGDLNLKDVGFNIKSLNTAFKIPQESIKLNAPDIYFNSFTMYDLSKNTFELDGKIGLSDVANPTFNLGLKAQKIQVLNATKKDNPVFYGNVNLNVNMQIEGDLNIPEITGKLAVNKGSDFTYIIPESELALVEKEGVVVFVNKKNPNAIITRREEEATSSILKGFDIQTILTVDKDAVFNIIVDERTGDKLQISGVGNFNLGVSTNGNTSLTGKYIVESGFYEVNLYNLVQKRFDLAKGSSVTWKGDPVDAEMQIRAIYKIETSASGLMATKNSASSLGNANRFSQKIPFLVYLNLDGKLLTPEISFNLDIPKDKQGEFGGAVYTQVQQLNTQEEELNKQVFSLLVLNQFFPKSSNDGSGGGSAKIARNNVNKVLTDQLNNFSSKYTEKTGLDLNFGLDSYTGASGKNQTKLDVSAQKKLLNNRLTINVGSEIDVQGRSQVSEQNTPIVGNVSLEYLLTENGRYILKGFRKNQFESVIDGQVIATGIAFIFNKEFNQFRELWQKSNKSEKSKSKKKDDNDK